jgi:hypothetical protein
VVLTAIKRQCLPTPIPFFPHATRISITEHLNMKITFTFTLICLLAGRQTLADNYANFFSGKSDRYSVIIFSCALVSRIQVPIAVAIRPSESVSTTMGVFTSRIDYRFISPEQPTQANKCVWSCPRMASVAARITEWRSRPLVSFILKE